MHKLTENVYRTRNHVCGSRTASHAWFHLKSPPSITPVLFLRVRCTAIVRSVLVKNIAFCGASGRSITRKIDMAAVMAPKKRKSSCQLSMALTLIVPMP